MESSFTKSKRFLAGKNALLLALLAGGLLLAYMGLEKPLIQLPGLGTLGLAAIDRDTHHAVGLLAPLAAIFVFIRKTSVAWYALGGISAALVLAVRRVFADAQILVAGGGDVGNAAAAMLARSKPLEGSLFLILGLLMLMLAAWRGKAIRCKRPQGVGHE